MDLKGKSLVDWLRKQPKEQFPGRRSYIHRYDELAEYLEKEVHPNVATGAALKDGIFLNDHGPDHVAMVIQRASELSASKNCTLLPYEAYLLLTAAQLHDIGNIFGRDGHESQPSRVTSRIEAILGDDAVEKRLVYSIAEAHGGSVNGDKDTIAYLQPNTAVLGKQIRPRLLAAMLRFADELADDRSRASRFGLSQGVIPDSSRLFHKYSEALHSVILDIKGATIELYFEIGEHDARQKYPKGAASVYLLDEITLRTMKMHRERIYCTRFMRPYVNFDSIKVTVQVYPSPNREQPYGDAMISIGYRLEDHGYPDAQTSICTLCPNLCNWHNGAPLSGDALVAKLDDCRNKQ